jgi:hypothetical protein
MKVNMTCRTADAYLEGKKVTVVDARPVLHKAEEEEEEDATV